MGGTNDPPERNDDQDDDLKAGEEVRGSPKRARCSRDFSKGGSFEKCCW
jgi:hypothetical protein